MSEWVDKPSLQVEATDREKQRADASAATPRPRVKFVGRTQRTIAGRTQHEPRRIDWEAHRLREKAKRAQFRELHPFQGIRDSQLQLQQQGWDRACKRMRTIDPETG